MVKKFLLGIIAALASIAAYATPPPSTHAGLYPQNTVSDSYTNVVTLPATTDVRTALFESAATKVLALRYMSSTATAQPPPEIADTSLARTREREKPDTIVTGARQNK